MCGGSGRKETNQATESIHSFQFDQLQPAAKLNSQDRRQSRCWQLTMKCCHPQLGGSASEPWSQGHSGQPGPGPGHAGVWLGLWFWGTVPGRQAGLQLKPSSMSKTDSFKTSISVTSCGRCSNCSRFHRGISNQLLITGLQFGGGTVRKRGQSNFLNFMWQL